LIVSGDLALTPGSEVPLEVRVVPADAAPPNAVIVIRGLPQGARLSEGRPFGPGVWVVPLTRLANLKLHSPADTDAAGILTVVLTSLEGTPIAEARTSVISVLPSKEPGQTTAAALPRVDPTAAVGPLPAGRPVEQPPTPPAPRIAVPNRAELLALLEKGRESARLGNILIARQFYLRAADKGLAEAALALAATYDARELSRLKGASGVTPDPDQARKWYGRAMELGSPEAAARLAELGSR
jgi:hypothetical protein